jgi:transcriptional regulator with XRE-family HTH domain
MAGDGEQELRERFGETVRIERLLRRESQEALAERAGIHRTQISFIEHGERTILLPTFVKYCGALGRSPDELLSGIAWQPDRFGGGTFQVASGEVWRG